MALGNLQIRMLSALVLIPLVFGALYLGGWFFSGLIALVIAACGFEWKDLVSALNLKPAPRFVYLFCGFFYFIFSCLLFVDIRLQHTDGFLLAVALLLCVWASDTGAYILGRGIGGPKLAPKISPNKTWAGLVGAMLGAALGLCTLLGIFENLSLPLLFVYGCVLGCVGQAGDLLESYFKRRAGLKDSGTLIPGHGGVLDRVDALLMMIPFFYLMLEHGL